MDSSTRAGLGLPPSGGQGGAAQVVVANPERKEIAEALRDRRVRALDILLVATGSTDKMSYADAKNFCAATDLGGVRWRLPTIGEIISLSKAKMVDPRLPVWSDTKADTWGDTRLTWSPRRSKIGTASLRWKGARAVCVHTRMDTSSAKP
jgi:hypothetical protein